MKKSPKSAQDTNVTIEWQRMLKVCKIYANVTIEWKWILKVCETLT